MLKRMFLPFLAMALMVWAVGCSSNPSEPDAADTPNFTDEFGGYTTAAEAPGFGDSELIAAEAEEEEIDDPLEASPEVSQLADDSKAAAFHFRAIWGQIPCDSTVTEVTDWSGSLSVSDGALLVRRLIRFEAGEDSLLPRTDRALVEWSSYTTIHNDGIAFDILVPARLTTYDTSWVQDGEDSVVVIDTVAPEPFSLTFETGPYTRVFDLADLAALDTVVTLEDSSRVAFQGFQMFRDGCPRGVMNGRWGFDEDGNGEFVGLWTNRYGRLIGYLRGHFGENDEGERVFYGKCIDQLGNFEGLIKGDWAPNPNEHANGNAFKHGGGKFRGKIYNAQRTAVGVVKGHYQAAQELHQGWFGGRWKLYCADEPATNNGIGTLGDGF